MTNIEQIMNLKKEANDDAIFNNVLHVFAQRERARREVTVSTLTHTMKKAGYEYSPQQVIPVLEKLSKLGFGRLEKDIRGRVRALRDIQVTLQSLGTVASQEKAEIKPFRPRNSFGKLSEETQEPRTPSPVIEAAKAKTALILTVMINDKPVNIQVPKGLSASEIAALVVKLRDTN